MKLDILLRFGDLIPVSVVDAIEDKEIQSHYKYVKNLADSNGISLTVYQIYALVSRTYNYGNAGGTGQATYAFNYPSTYTFVEAYKEFYNQSTDTHYGEKDKVDFNNELYTKYMKTLTYTDGTYPPGWVTRRENEWCLFQTGYMGYNGKGIDEYVILGGDLSEIEFNGSNYVILEKANEVITTARTNGYFQSSSEGGSGYEDACLGFAYTYAYAATTGDLACIKTKGTVQSTVSSNGDVTGTFGSSIYYSDKQELVKRIYQELLNGKACVIQVVGSYVGSNPTKPKTRHYVAAVGYKNGVTEDTVQDTDLLILDVWNATMKAIVPEGTSGRYLLDGKKSSYGYNYNYQMITTNAKAYNKTTDSKSSS